MNKRVIIWALLLVLIFELIFNLIPIDVYDGFPILFGLLGSITYMGCMFMFMSSLESVKSAAMPFAIISGVILFFSLIFYHSGRISDELATHGKLTKGTVNGGESTTTTRRFQKNTSYSILVGYQDSLNKQHVFDASVTGSEFNDLYRGAEVDVVYSKRYPAIAKAVFSIDELSKYKHVPQEQLTITHLINILEQKVNKDSVLDYLNTINYEWHPGSEDGVYNNERLKAAVKIAPDNQKMAYACEVGGFIKDDDDFESTLTQNGFSKKASDVDGKEQLLYYNDRYVIAKETTWSDDSNDNNILGRTVYQVFYIQKLSAD
jgi:hypothetical protein